MKVGLLSFADCNNYGDKYFAPIFKSQLLNYLPEAEFVLITPTGVTLEGERYSDYDPAVLEEQLDALLLVGGEVAHTEDILFSELYARQGLTTRMAHPTDLVFGSPYLNIAYKAWLSTGISSSISSTDSAQKLSQVIPLLHRVMLRGVLARDNLDALTGRNLYTEVVPDLGWLIPFHKESAPPSPDSSPIPSQFDPGRPYLIFHTFPAMASDPAELERIAATLLKLQADSGLAVVLLPITYYTGDNELLIKLNQAANGEFFVMPGGMSRADTTRVIVGATISITSSLHGAITSLAAGIPAGVVHSGETKFYDLFGMQQRFRFFRREWSSLYNLGIDLLNEPREPLLRYASEQRKRLEVMFKQVAGEIRMAQTHPPEYPYRSQFDDNVKSFRRNEWVHASNLNELLRAELAGKNLQVQAKTAEALSLNSLVEKSLEKNVLPEVLSQYSTKFEAFFNNLETSLNQIHLQKQQELDSSYQAIIEHQASEIEDLKQKLQNLKKEYQAVSSQAEEWKAQFKGLQNTRTVRVTRNLKILTNTFRQIAKVPFEEIILGELDPPQLEILTVPYLRVLGWAASSQGEIKTVEVFLEGVSLGEAYYGLERPEIILARPLQLERHCGFAGQFKLDLDQFSPGSSLLRVSITDSKGNNRQVSSSIVLPAEMFGTTKSAGSILLTPDASSDFTPKASKQIRPKGKLISSGSRRPVSFDRLEEVKLFVAGAGNSFMLDIARIFQFGFRKLGLSAEILVDQVPSLLPGAHCLQLVVAPHEFYPLFIDKKFGETAAKQLTQAVFLLNVEQPHSQWFEQTFKIARYAAGIWDINQQGVAEFKRRGLHADYAPLGYAPFLEAKAGSRAEVHTADKPVDILFLGSSSKRREKILAANSNFLNRYNCHLVLSQVNHPRLSTTPGYVNEEERAGLVRNSAILLNLHFGKQAYFEWHRALIAFSNRCLFITEPCDSFSPLVEGKHFILAESNEITDVCQHYLEDKTARQAIVEEAYHFVTTTLDAAEVCRFLLGNLAKL
jgi:hypothetical protein